MLKIEDYLVSGDNVRGRKNCTKTSGEFERGYPDTIVIHYTAGPYQSSLDTLVNPKVKASAHVLIDRDGTILREPEDEQIDSFEKFQFVPGAISALRFLRWGEEP